METAAISLVAEVTRQYPRRPSSNSATTPEASPATMQIPILLAANAMQRFFMFCGFGVTISHHPIVPIRSFPGWGTGPFAFPAVRSSSRIVRDSGVDVFSFERCCAKVCRLQVLCRTMRKVLM